MAATLAGRGVVKCRPRLKQNRSVDCSSDDSAHHASSTAKLTNLQQTATGKGGDATEPTRETTFQCEDMENLADHALHLGGQGFGHSRGKRLSEKELGPYYAESQMPSALFEKLAAHEFKQTQHMDALTGQLYRVNTLSNELRNIMPSIAYLLHCLSANTADPSPSFHTVTLCHPCIRHVFKTPSEGGFCGYRNAQTLCSFIAGTNWRAAGEQVLTREGKWRAKDTDMLPNVPELQQMIEAAWDLGINSHCRDETGGLVGRRVYIGSPEVQALLLSLSIPAATYSITGVSKKPAHEALLDAVVRHFRPYTAPAAAVLVEECLATGGTLRKTVAPPLFLQQPGHSLTIVGYQVHSDNSRSLIVLDPGYVVSPAVREIAGRLARPRPRSKLQDNVDSGWAAYNSKQLNYVGYVRESASGTVKKVHKDVLPADAEKLLKVYQRGADKLSRYKEFELVTLE